MNFEFPPDTLVLRDMLRRFVEKEARPLERKFFTSGELAAEERARLRKAVEQLGLWGLMVPMEYGGGGLDMVTTCMIEEELGKTFVPVEMGDVNPLLYACKDEQVHRYLEPALAGTRRAVLAAREPGLRPQFQPERLYPKEWNTSVATNDGEYTFNGCKILTEQPDPDDFLILLVNPPEGPTAFLLDAGIPGFNLSKNEHFILTLSDCRVGGEALLGEPGKCLAQRTDDAQHAWIRMGARYIGIAERMLDMTVDHAKNWVSLGASLSLRPAIRRLLAELRVEIDCSRWLVYFAAWRVDEGQKGSDRGLAAQVRLATGEMLQHAVDRVTMIYTGPGPSPQIELQRFIGSMLPSEALDLALDHARAILTAELLDLPES
jgi:alkylation response protein AidB-like acyl-CoA dehydrogenase